MAVAIIAKGPARLTRLPLRHGVGFGPLPALDQLAVTCDAPLTAKREAAVLLPGVKEKAMQQKTVTIRPPIVAPLRMGRLSPTGGKLKTWTAGRRTVAAFAYSS